MPVSSAAVVLTAPLAPPDLANAPPARARTTTSTIPSAAIVVSAEAPVTAPRIDESAGTPGRIPIVASPSCAANRIHQT
jgi:hypothetical protein